MIPSGYQPPLDHARVGQSSYVEYTRPTLRKMGGAVLVESEHLAIIERDAKWQETQRIRELTLSLRNLALPFVEAALYELPPVSEAQKTEKLRFMDAHSKKGGKSWRHQANVSGHEINYSFVLEYLKEDNRNRLMRIQVNTFVDKPVDDHRVADFYTMITVDESNTPTAIMFGGKGGTTISEMPDNLIEFSDEGISYTGWRTYPDQRIPTAYIYRNYVPNLNVFSSEFEQGGHTVLQPDMSVEKLFNIARTTLSVIPMEDPVEEAA